MKEKSCLFEYLAGCVLNVWNVIYKEKSNKRFNHKVDIIVHVTENTKHTTPSQSPSNVLYRMSEMLRTPMVSQN